MIIRHAEADMTPYPVPDSGFVILAAYLGEHRYQGVQYRIKYSAALSHFDAMLGHVRTSSVLLMILLRSSCAFLHAAPPAVAKPAVAIRSAQCLLDRQW